jgi:hypothetical protein
VRGPATQVAELQAMAPLMDRAGDSGPAASCPAAARPNFAPQGSATPTPHALAAERLAARAEKAVLVPWRQAIATARAAKREAKATRQQARAARIAARATQRAAHAPATKGQKRAAHPNAPSSPPASLPAPIAPHTGDSPLEHELAARAAGLRAPANRPPQGAPTPAPTAPIKPSRIDPLNHEPRAKPGSTVPLKPSRIDPVNREPTVPTEAAAPRSTTLAGTWESSLASQLAARFGHPSPAQGWRIPQVMSETGPVAATVRGFLAAHPPRKA